MGDVDGGVRAQLLEGLPVRVQGMAEELVETWERAVEAVPALAHAASVEVISLLRLDARERERWLRDRWQRHHEGIELVGRAQPLLRWDPTLGAARRMGEPSGPGTGA